MPPSSRHRMPSSRYLFDSSDVASPCRDPRWLPLEEDVPGQHGGDAWNLLLLMHVAVAGSVGLEVQGHAAGHPGQDAQQVPERRTF